MQSTSHKSVFRKYYLACLLILLIYISFVVFCICVYPNIWSVIFCTILYLPVKIFIRISANKTIASVLFRDLNAQQFHQIITSNKHFLPPLSYRINAAFFTGDYQTVVNIAFCQIQKKRCSINKKVFYLSLSARAYFELRDFNKLDLILKKYDEIKELYPSKKLFHTANSIWSYYRYFLDGNFEACKTICREKLLELNSKAWDAKIRKLNNDFFYAVACYENGDTNDAVRCFESMIAYAPHMNSSELSIRYVEAIRTDSEISLLSEIIPDEGYQIEENKSLRKLKILEITGWLLIIVSVISGLVLSFVTQNDSTKKDTEYVEQLHNVIDVSYDNFKLLGYCNVEIDNKIVDVVALVEYEDKIDVVSYVAYEDGTRAIEKRIVDIKPGITYSFMSTSETHILYVSLIDNDNYDNELTKIEFKDNKQEMAFVVKQVAPLD